ncbi:unnamed protein product [Enterobius vermicularis]|uniref:KIX_2 domain-containing protein n=1 Tax=Enterobius vermicularis TaxID=51028 RepID=A0A0N4UXD3_ENTVE|nr:unnamed protein product [Enterobius vermicularis]
MNESSASDFGGFQRPFEEQRLPPLPRMIQTLRRQFQLLLATYKRGLRLPRDVDEDQKSQLQIDEIRGQRVFLQYMKLYLRDMEHELESREVRVSRQANTPKPEGQEDNFRTSSPSWGYGKNAKPSRRSCGEAEHNPNNKATAEPELAGFALSGISTPAQNQITI